jgi:lipopolysaccharide/colanic/teichoic acid biosynthesis glycosyltransferase
LVNGGQHSKATTTEDRSLAESETLDTEGEPLVLWREHLALVESALPAVKLQQVITKWFLDVFGAGVALIFVLPLLGVLAILIKLDSPGPVVFVQRRVGRGGRPFKMLKLRTMEDGADDQKDSVGHLNQTNDSRLFKIPADPRVTRLGRVIRRWSLDELPQLFNVLVGDMSLVGPRPFFESDLEDYEAHHFWRLTVKPGLTGLWQVSGRSEIVDFEEVVRLDRHYIQNWSVGLELAIIARTVPTVLKRRGAY